LSCQCAAPVEVIGNIAFFHNVSPSAARDLFALPATFNRYRTMPAMKTRQEPR